MSAFADGWHAAAPLTHAFYRNFALQHTYICTPRCPKDPPEFGYFTTFGWSFLGYKGNDIASHNWSAQLWHTGSFHPDVILLAIPLFPWNGPEFEPVYNYDAVISWGRQLRDIPVFCWNYPSPKFRARRSYWTGKPRRRRNYTGP